ncbi:MAG: histidinol phosphate phosphatase, partial [Campylobacter concisus]|nr:histidinol phosphate phosphatase [Campylobacter concisus]
NDITITFGSDAHTKEDIGKNGEICEQIARNLGYSKCAIFKNRDRELVKF